MRTSEAVDQLYAALAAAQGEYPVVPKTREAEVQMKAGGTYKYSYADLGDAVEAARPVNATHGLLVTQMPGMMVTDAGVAYDLLTTRVAHSSGQWQEDTMRVIAPQGATAQVFGSGLTYTKRFAYCAALGIVVDIDDDGTLAQLAYGEGPKATRKRAPRASTPVGGTRRQSPAQDAATEGKTGMTAKDRNRLIAHLARLDPPVRGDDAVAAHLATLLQLEEVVPAVKLTAEQGAKAFGLLGLDPS